MAIVTLQLPEVKVFQENRPTRCPYCPGDTFQRWGGAWRGVKDPHVDQVRVYRYRCGRCRRTFRHYPAGVSGAQQTQRLVALAAIGWLLGLSYRGQATYLSAFGLALSRMSIWRDVQQRAAQLERERWRKPVRVLGVDGAYVRGWGQTQPVVVAVDLGTGQPVAVGAVDEKDPQAVKRFLEPLVARLGVSVIVSDDLASYKPVADQLQVEQQICQFHVRRWVGQAVHQLKASLPPEWVEVAEEVRQILRELPVEGDKRLVAILRRLPPSAWSRAGGELAPVDKLRFLVVRLMENWAKFRVFDWQAGVPWTNNPTEQVIGRMKMRARTVRGYKTWAGMQNGLMVSGVGIS